MSVHSREDELSYVLEGEFDVYVGEKATQPFEHAFAALELISEGYLTEAAIKELDKQPWKIGNK